jgi:Ca2+-binding EF-hand superfamily protein
MRFLISNLCLICTAVFLFLAVPVYADEVSRNREIQERFAKCDINRDGKLTMEEAKGCMPRIYDHFSRIDEQGRGYVTVAQIEAMADR